MGTVVCRNADAGLPAGHSDQRSAGRRGGCQRPRRPDHRPVYGTLAELDPDKTFAAPLTTELQLLSNMMGAAGGCIGKVQTIQPAQKYIEVTALRLRPLKMYTAVVRNLKNNDSTTAAEVHRYNFQTSRYAGFIEHINSYLMRDAEGNERKANFYLPLALTTEQLGNAWQIMQGNDLLVPENSPDLNAMYPDRFDRIVLGVWEIPPMHPPTCTEINFIRIPPNKGAYALLIRSPEPFNDPKMPSDVLQQTVKVLYNGQEEPAFKKLSRGTVPRYC